MSSVKQFLKQNKIELNRNNKWTKPCPVTVDVQGLRINFKVKLITKKDFPTHEAKLWPAWLINAFDMEAAKIELETALLQTLQGSSNIEVLQPRLVKLASKVHTPNQLVSEFAALGEELKGYLLEQEKFDDISRQLDMDQYPKIFRAARLLKRHFKLVLGPTNSGKTYTAMNALASAQNGCYLAPLRLLALEGQEALFERGVKANLITGEEKHLLEGSRHTASTIEMCDFSTMVEVAVIDEVQLISDESRGWAWTAAICGVPAQTIYLVGSEDCLHWVLPLLERLGDTYEIERFTRKSALVPEVRPVNLADIKPGDALIAFSRQDVLYWRQEVAKTGMSTAVIYGSLSPEVRRMEARRFSSGLAQVLIATDAVGMGLNLPISRIVLTTLDKYDGESTRRLHPYELAQIIGRAGRFGKVAEGKFAAMNSVEHALLQKLVKNPLREKPEEIRCFVSPNAEQVRKLGELLNTDSLGSVLTFFNKYVVKDDPLFIAAPQEETIALAWRTDRFRLLDLATRYVYSCAPLDQRCDFHLKALESWMAAHEVGNIGQLPSTQGWDSMAASDFWLLTAEQTSRLASLYLWLSLRFPEIFPHTHQAVELRASLSKFIEKTLESANKKRKTK